ncbi:hypothetical protein [Hydrogenophaga sp.]|uniref:hypothetical protein n=1 Tax=Hydrogenophaga sp. TaxID=1904254 RepID=UPI003F6BA788
MFISTQPQGSLTACAPEIQALSHMGSKHAVLGGLLAIASRYGKVGEITALERPQNAASDHDIFLVNFEETADAIVAARKLKCHLFGFSTLLVSVPH